MKTIDQLGKNELNGKKVLLRVDFNVPISDGKIAEVFRIKAVKETIDYLLGNGAKVALVSHIEATPSFEPVVEQISEILGQKIIFIPLKDFTTGNWKLETGNLLFVDNIRQDPREIKNDKRFALSLSKGFDFYVNDAFAVCHRKHASVSAITEFLPSYTGFLVKKETENLSEAIKAPAEGKVVVLGGAKISTKLPVIKNFLDKAEKILIGGALANNFFKQAGIDVGDSLVDDSVSCDIESEKIILPEDIMISPSRDNDAEARPYPVKDIGPGHYMPDIGPETAEHFAEIIKGSRLVIWGGPMGLYEVRVFAMGTETVARAVAGARHSIIGGGDTIAAADKFGLLDKFSFVSTGGGAMLEFLAGNKLPGLEALGYYK